MKTNHDMFEAIETNQLDRVTGGLFFGDGGCVQPAPKRPTPTRPRNDWPFPPIDQLPA